MQHVILGLLLVHGPLTLYAVQRQFTAGVSLFYSASFGSIQRALRQLVDRGLVDVASPGERGQKPYSITADGEREWREWMRHPITGSDAETTALAKVFFLGAVDTAERAAVLSTIRERITADLAELDGTAEGIDRVDVPAEFADLLRFQRATLDYGIRAHRLALEWVAELEAGPVRG